MATERRRYNTCLSRRTVRPLMERQIQLDPGFVCLVDPGRLRHQALAFGALGRHEMPAGGVLPQDFACGGDLEPLRDGLAGFAARDRFWHKARKITHLARVTSILSPRL